MIAVHSFTPKQQPLSSLLGRGIFLAVIVVGKSPYHSLTPEWANIKRKVAISPAISSGPAEINFRVDTAFKVAGQLVRPVADSFASSNRAVGLPSRNNSQRG